MRRFALCMALISASLSAVQLWFLTNQTEPRPVPVPVARGEAVWTESEPHIGPSLHEHGRPCLFDAKWHKLGATRYAASLGPNYYQDVPERTPAFYTIRVCFEPAVDQPPNGLPALPEVIPVMFSRDFRMDELPDGFLNRSPAEIVTFDAATSLVTFHLGEKRITYRLPMVFTRDVGGKQVTYRLPDAAP